MNLNVKGRAPPYASGTEVILWRWTDGGAANLVWSFDVDTDRRRPDRA